MKIAGFWTGSEWTSSTGNPPYPGFTLLGAVNTDAVPPPGPWGNFYALRSCIADTEGVEYSLGSDADDKVTLGCFSHRTNSGTPDMPLWQFVEGTTTHITLMGEADGSITVRRGGSTGTTLITIPASALRPYPLVNHLQFVVTIHDTTGAVDVYIDGAATPAYTYSGDTRNGGTSGIVDKLRMCGTVSTSAHWFFGHIYLLSGISGALPDVLGPCRTARSEFGSTGTYTAWTGSATDVDDWSLATGLTSATNGQLESIAAADITDADHPGSVAQVRVNVLGQDLGTPGDGQIEVGLLSSGIASYASPWQPSIAGEAKQFVFDNDPATAAPWAAGAAGRSAYNSLQTIVRSIIV